MKPGRRSRRGFTLVEATITITIMALSATVVITSLSGIGLADLRATAGKTCGLVKQTYDQAALSGQTYRLTFDFEASSISAGATSAVLAFEPGSNILAEAAQADETANAFHEMAAQLTAEAEEMRDDDDEDAMPNAAAAFFGVNNLSSPGMAGEEAFTDNGDGLKLAEGVKLLSVWIQGMDEPVAKGKSYLYFFPHGYTQDALIHLSDGEDTVYTVKVHALTGKTSVFGKYVGPPK